MHIASRPVFLSSSKGTDTTYTLSEDLSVQAGKRLKLDVPREHRLLTLDTSRQSLNVFSESAASKLLEVEGKVTQKAELQPVNSTAYMQLKR